MTVKILLLKSGEDVVADVKEMISPDDKVIGYFLTKPCVIKLIPKTIETEEGETKETSISMYPWMPLAKEKDIPLPTDWVEKNTLSPWLVECTNQSVFMLSSDKILTLIDPKPTILEKYQDLLK